MKEKLQPIIITLVVAYLLTGVFQDLIATYQNLQANLVGIPVSLIFYGIAAIFISVISLLGAWVPRLFLPLIMIREKIGWLRWLFAIIPLLAVNYFFFYTKWGFVFGGIHLRLIAFLCAYGIMAWFLSKRDGCAFTWEGLLVSIILLGVITTYARLLHDVNNYPFSITWSEGNRIWDYSIPFGRSLYDYPAEKPISVYSGYIRASLWGLPFLLPGVSIGLVRLWSVIVFTIPYAVLGWVLLRMKDGKKDLWFLFGLWSLLFLNLGPIYSPLVLAATLVAAIRKTPIWFSIILVVLASVYAKAGRFSWVFAPGIWAFFLIFIGSSMTIPIKVWKRWVYATALALIGCASGYFIGSLDVTQIVGSVNRQPLLWDRLWPNPTNSLGIIPGLLLAAGPLMIILLYLYFSKKWLLDIWQALALAGGLGAFLMVGIVASVKIGGGSNLHNLDMFLVGLVFSAVLAWENGGRDWVCVQKGAPWWVRIFLLAAIAYPAMQYVLYPALTPIPGMEKASAVLDEIRGPISEAAKRGEVLFMDQRQLLTFGYIDKVPFVPEYEKKLVMDMAMAGDETYFAPFYKDLSSHRFSLIVSEPLRLMTQESQKGFSDENDAWVNWVSIPILCYYKPIYTDTVVGVQLLQSKEKASPQPGITCP